MKDLLALAEWTNGKRIKLRGCSVPIQKWTIPQLRFRLSFEPDFWSRLAVVKQLVKRGFTCEQVAEFEVQSTDEVFADLPGAF